LAVAPDGFAAGLGRSVPQALARTPRTAPAWPRRRPSRVRPPASL